MNFETVVFHRGYHANVAQEALFNRSSRGADSGDVELPFQVMAGPVPGLVPAIHAFLAQSPKEDVDARDKRGQDDGGRRWREVIRSRRNML